MITARHLDIGLSVGSGQPLAFYGNYRRVANAEYLDYATTKGMVSIRSRKFGGVNRISWEAHGYSDSEAEQEVRRRLALNDDMERIYSRIGTDKFMLEAILALDGMRVTHNDPWETTICFVISQFNNIKRIRLIINNMIREFGETITYNGKEMRLFPTAEALASAELSRIRKCGTGFRDRYIKSVAQAWVEHPELYSLGKKNYRDAKGEIMKLDGVGDKVADCILLFGYNKLEAFPIDLWVKRIIENIYFKGRRKPIGKIHEFANKNWPGYEGYAQQYIFWWGRLNAIGKKKVSL